MCLLINQKPGHCFSKEWLTDFYSHNKDGFGIMYAKKGRVVVEKLVPRTVDDLIEFYYKKAAGKACSIHLRMKTHGDIDLVNCHPYTVFDNKSDYPLFLMHNGVLSTGNAADKSKSDTWHYIKNIIRPALAADPSKFTEEWFKDLLESHIGARNKFVLVDALGNTVTINEHAGEDWNGNWMSNTYAWDAVKAGVKKAPPVYGGNYGGGFGGKGSYVPPAKKSNAAPLKSVSKPKADVKENNVFDMPGKSLAPAYKTLEEELEEAMSYQDLDSLGGYLKNLQADSIDYCNDLADALIKLGYDMEAGQIYMNDVEDLFYDDMETAIHILDSIQSGVMTGASLLLFLEGRMNDKIKIS